MEIKNNQRIIVSGRTVCLVAGIIAMLCGLYWIVRALMFDGTNLPAMLSAITCGLLLTLYGRRRWPHHPTFCLCVSFDAPQPTILHLPPYGSGQCVLPSFRCKL